MCLTLSYSLFQGVPRVRDQRPSLPSHPQVQFQSELGGWGEEDRGSGRSGKGLAAVLNQGLATLGEKWSKY